MRSIRCRTASSPSNRPSGALSMRPPRSTYTSSGPLTMTSVTSGSCSRNSIGPNPTTSSDTSLTMRVSSRWGKDRAARPQQAERFVTYVHPPLRARRRGEPASVDTFPQLVAQLTAHPGELVCPHRGRMLRRLRHHRPSSIGTLASDIAVLRLLLRRRSGGRLICEPIAVGSANVTERPPGRSIPEAAHSRFLSGDGTRGHRVNRCDALEAILMTGTLR